MNKFKIAQKAVGQGHPPFVVAEVAQTHDGSLNSAHAFIDATADAGADAIKFQTHIADAETTVAEPWRIPFSRQDETRFAYWKRMEFSEVAWRGLAEHATERGLVFLSSPFSLEAVDLLDSVGVPAWKIASGEVSNTPLIKKLAATGKPVILSSGLSGWDELDRAVELVQSARSPLAVLQCTTAYPCPPERIGLNVLEQLEKRYRCPVGLSDHSATIYGGLAAVTLGASIIEVHVTFHRKMFGPDVPASITFEELSQLVQGCRFISTALINPTDKEQEAKDLLSMRKLFTKSIMARAPLQAGTTLSSDDVVFKKPGTGIPASALDRVIGRKLQNDVDANTMFQWSDFDGEQEA